MQYFKEHIELVALIVTTILGVIGAATETKKESGGLTKWGIIMIVGIVLTAVLTFFNSLVQKEKDEQSFSDQRNQEIENIKTTVKNVRDSTDNLLKRTEKRLNNQFVKINEINFEIKTNLDLTNTNLDSTKRNVSAGFNFTKKATSKIEQITGNTDKNVSLLLYTVTNYNFENNKLTIVSTTRDNYGSPLEYDFKGRKVQYESIFNKILNEKRNELSLAFKLDGIDHNYKLDLILKFLLTHEGNFQLFRSEFDNDSLIKVHHFLDFKNRYPLFKNILFFNVNNEVEGYCDVVDFVNEISLYYLNSRSDDFEQLINNRNSEQLLKNLKCIKNTIFKTNQTSTIASQLIAKKESECLNIINNKYYKVKLADIILIK